MGDLEILAVGVFLQDGFDGGFKELLMGVSVTTGLDGGSGFATVLYFLTKYSPTI